MRKDKDNKSYHYLDESAIFNKDLIRFLPSCHVPKHTVKDIL